MNKWFRNSAIVPVLFLAACVSSSYQSHYGQREKEIPFNDFITEIRTAQFKDYAGRTGARVESEAAFEEMRQHLLFLYDGVTPINTFIGRDDQFVDCVPIEQQPGLRDPKTGPQRLVREAPAASAARKTVTDGGSGDAPKRHRIADLTLKPGVRDRFGREMYCRVESIPMRRVTLEQMTRFRNLQDFFSKGAGRFQARPLHGQDRPGLLVPGAENHYYAAAFQNVDNFGGDSWLNLWSPAVSDHEMSLSQIWVSGGTGADTQTVEAGWQVMPDKWSSNNAALFIFYTPDNYAGGCYNIGCGFVQIANNVYLGAGFDHYSVRDGGQWGFNIQVKRATDGNWWIFYRGPAEYIPIGYYPRSLYGGGVMSMKADSIGWGGEDTGETHALQMGSGAGPAEGFGRAAYHDVVFYIDTSTVSQWSNLFAVEQPGATCYSTAITNASGKQPKTYFYFGGATCN